MVGAVFVVSPADPYHRTPLVGMASAKQYFHIGVYIVRAQSTVVGRREIQVRP